jgi:hypothetical protein
MRSAWLKYARASEHQRYLARLGREFHAGGPTYRYERDDNSEDGTDDLVRVAWRVRVLRTYPERWGVVLGDVVGALRAALDHAMYAAVEAHSGSPDRPASIDFPITTKKPDFENARKRLAELVNARTWEIVDAVQPLHGEKVAHTAPLEILRWMSNVDKHRYLHIVGRAQVDLGAPLVESPMGELEVVEQEMLEGQAIDGATVGRVVFRRPATSGPVDVRPTFAHTPSVQICDHPRLSTGRCIASLQ